MTEDVVEKKDKKRDIRSSFGPLKATMSNDYKVVGEDWGGLKPQVAKKKLKVGDRVGKHGIYKGLRGIYDERNRLNDLTGREWAISTKSWFIHNPLPRSKKDTLLSKKEILHPAKFPETMIIDFIKFFTKKGEFVLDPMVGTGSTLVACDKTKRKGVGIELIKKWADIAAGRTRQLVIRGDARKLKELLAKVNISQVDFCITSPPYWSMLKKSRGHVFSLQKQRKARGLDEYYSDDPNDLGNIEDYDSYLSSLCDIYAKVYDILRPGRYFVVICQNILTSDGVMVPFAWDLAKKLCNIYILKQERLWLQDNKLLGIWGYPFRYVSNVHHHYCLIFEKHNHLNVNEQ